MGQRLVEPVEGLLLVALMQLAYRPAHAPGILVFRQAGVAGQCVESGQVGFHLFQMSGGDGIVAEGSRDIQFYGKVGGALGFLLGQPQVTDSTSRSVYWPPCRPGGAWWPLGGLR